jgi:hypothetical protein
MLIWTCPTHEEWDRYLCGERTDRDDALSEHLAVCPVCRLIVYKRQNDFYAAAASWESVKSGRVIPLAVWTGGPAPITASVRLAAQGTEESTLPQSITLVSPDQQLLMRAVKDRNTGETWLYLLSDNPGNCRSVLVRPFNWDREYLTDAEGRVNLGVIEWPGPSMRTAEVRSPMATFTLTPSQGLSGDESVAVLSTPDGDKIRVTVSRHGRYKRVEIEVLRLGEMESGAPVKVAIREGPSSDITLVSSESGGHATFGDVKAIEPIEIFLFQ